MIKKLAIILVSILAINTLCYGDTASQIAKDYLTNPNETTFTDLDQAKWAEESIYAIAKYGVIEAKEGKVYPNNFITRGDFVRMLIAVFGMYDENAECSFKDIKKENRNYKYIATAYQMEVVKGISEEEFGINDHITREDLATIIYRMAQKCNIDMGEIAELDFVDNNNISDYSTEAISALVGAKAINGDENHYFLPKKSSTFAEVCKIIYYLMLKNT